MCPLCTLLEACHCATASLQQTVERRKLWLQLERGITAEVCRFRDVAPRFFFKRWLCQSQSACQYLLCALSCFIRQFV